MSSPRSPALATTIIRAGFAIHHELRMLVEAGLTPYEALATGNVNVAKFFGEEDEFGRVAVGQRADLVLLEADALDDVDTARRPPGRCLVPRDERAPR